ncbi:MAG: ATP-binding protein [Proteobacteria bacterium]|nr:ATP-binding protein [Pseudomonadota bacterium]
MTGSPRSRTPLRIRLLAFNALLVFLPAAGVLFLDTYEERLLADQERSMVAQGQALAAALSGRGALRKEEAVRTLVELGQRSGARIRIVAPGGTVLADSSLLGPRREPDAELPTTADPNEPWLYRLGALPFRFYRLLFGPPDAPHGTADVYRAGQPVLGREVRAALAGRYGAATRISSGGQRSVTLYSAVPVVDAGRPVGAILISQSTFRILQALTEVRIGVFQVFLASLAAAVLLSLLMSRTIAGPLVRLRNQADALLDRRGRLQGRFEISDRRDEIGDLARALETLRGRLDEHLGAMQAFAADVSHEFKNPLASIRSASEMLSLAETPDERKRFLDVVQREIARMEGLLTAVLEISRLDAETDDEDREPLALAELLEGVVEAQRLRSGRPPRLRVADSDLRVHANPERLTQVLENLLENAAGFSPEPDSVEIELARERDAARIRVSDRGPGIPPEHLDRLFDRFFSYRPDADGLPHAGLGLAIARALVERAGGRIEARNRPEGGACFELRLPLARAARPR